MKNVKKIFEIRFVLALIFALSLFLPISANSDAARTVKLTAKSENLIASNLLQKIKADLSESNLSVQLTNIEESKISENLIELKGAAFCVFQKDQTQLPITFKANFNPSKQVVSEINYTFVETSENGFAPSTDEEMLMKTLMKKLSADYKTGEITMAIDKFEILKTEESGTVYKGFGEVKIGEMVWNKIDFNVVLNKDNSPSQIEYKVKQ